MEGGDLWADVRIGKKMRRKGCRYENCMIEDMENEKDSQFSGSVQFEKLRQ